MRLANNFVAWVLRRLYLHSPSASGCLLSAKGRALTDETAVLRGAATATAMALGAQRIAATQSGGRPVLSGIRRKSRVESHLLPLPVCPRLGLPPLNWAPCLGCLLFWPAGAAQAYGQAGSLGYGGMPPPVGDAAQAQPAPARH